jgi:hypothetical protein
MIGASIMRLIVALSAVVVLSNNSSAACERYSFENKLDYLDSVTSDALVKIYSDRAGEDYSGTATVIDAERGLLLTASHVSKYGGAYVKFPFMGSDKLYKADELIRLKQAYAEDEISGRSWSQGRDVLILKLRQPPSSLVALEIKTEELAIQNKVLHFYGFNGDKHTAQEGNSKASIPNPPDVSLTPTCTFDLKESAELGDSGAPVLDQTGVIVGVLIQESNGNRSGRFVPASCFQTALMSAIDDPNREDDDADLNQLVSTMDQWTDYELKKKLATSPYPRDGSEISNIELAAILRAATTTPDYLSMLSRRHKCPVRNAIIDRGINLDLYDGYYGALTDKLAQTKTELLKLEGDFFSNESLRYGVNDYRYKLYNQRASRNYEEFLSAQLSREPSANKFVIVMDAAGTLPTSRTLVPQTLKAMADVELRLASLESGVSTHLHIAQASAAAAAILLLRPMDQAGAIATVADTYLHTALVSGKESDFDKARAGYGVAANGGFNKRWVAMNYDHSYKAQYNVRVATKASPYVKLGAASNIQDAKPNSKAIRAALQDIANQSQSNLFSISSKLPISAAAVRN